MAQLPDLYNDRTLHHSQCTPNWGSFHVVKLSSSPNEGQKKEAALITANKTRPSFTMQYILYVIQTHPLPQIIGEHQVAREVIQEGCVELQDFL